MAEKFKDEGSKARSDQDDARSDLEKNWAQMTASMVSPGGARGSPVKKRRSNGAGPAPLPISALPVPEAEPEPTEEPGSLTLSANEGGELTPAQRARLGLDLEPSSEDPAAQSAANAPEAPPAEQPLQPPSQRPAPRAQPQDTQPPARPRDIPPAPPEPATRQADSAAAHEPTGRPAATPAANAAPAQPIASAAVPAAVPEPASPEQPVPDQPAGTSFDFRAMDAESGGAEAPPVESQAAAEPVRLRPVSDQPRLKPVSDSGPKLAPVRRPAASASPRGGVQLPAAAKVQQRRSQTRRQGQDEDFEEIKRDRNVLTYGVAWSAFAIVMTGAIAFTSSMSGDPAASAGPGPLIPGLLSIALGWVIVIAARGMGNGWWSLMLIPAVVLLVGPYVYKNYWAGNVERAAHSYLSNFGTGVLIDVDATSVVSETVNTDRGCFSINRTRKNNDTEVAVSTYQAETARQQADYALAPRYAGRIAAGGERSLHRVFTFKGGRAPAIVSTPTTAPLDCKNSTSAPGTGAKRGSDE